MVSERLEKRVLAIIGEKYTHDSDSGPVKIVAEVEGKGQYSKIIEPSINVFGPDLSVFVHNGLKKLKEDYPTSIFLLKVSPPISAGSNLYSATSKDIEIVGVSDYIEIVSSDYEPNPNIRYLSVRDLPCTKYIFISHMEDIYGPFEWKIKNNDKNVVLIEPAPLGSIKSANGLSDDEVLKIKKEDFISIIEVNGRKITKGISPTTQHLGQTFEPDSVLLESFLNHVKKLTNEHISSCEKILIIKAFDAISKSPKFKIRPHILKNQSERIKKILESEISINESIKDFITKNTDLSTITKSQQESALSSDSTPLPSSRDTEIVPPAEIYNTDVSKNNKELEQLQLKIEDRRQEIARLNSIYDNLELNVKASSSILQNKLSELLPFITAVTTAKSPIDNPTLEVENLHIDPCPEEVSPASIISEISKKLKKEQRSMSDAAIVNLLISTQQSFVTVLAGLPGSGKTSTVNLFAKSQNIEKRLKEVSVQRGWTSLRDLIGIYNPLISKFQASSTGLFSFLSAIAQDSLLSGPMAYVLLDEANLSPLEHYWSAFMKLCDDNEESRKIHLGGDTLIRIPPNLRFISTINYDGTTEPLSPRFIDRAPIILLSSENSYEAISKVSISTNNLPLSGLAMSKLFGNEKETPPLTEKEKLVYSSVKDILGERNPDLGASNPISMRKANAIAQYCYKFNKSLPNAKSLFGLDLAISQHVLPSLQGTGKQYLARLENLRKIISDANLVNSEEILNRIITEGKSDLDSYSFFN